MFVKLVFSKRVEHQKHEAMLTMQTQNKESFYVMSLQQFD